MTFCPVCCPACLAVQAYQRCQVSPGFRAVLHWRVHFAAARSVQTGLPVAAHAVAQVRCVADPELDVGLVRPDVHAPPELAAGPAPHVGHARQDAAADLHVAHSDPGSRLAVYGQVRPHDVAPRLDCGLALAQPYCLAEGLHDSRADWPERHHGSRD